MFEKDIEELKALGADITTAEIKQQPELWRDAYNIYRENKDAVEAFLADLHRQADDVARESLALDALARKLEIEVTDEDVDAEFARAGVEDPEASKAAFVAEGRIPAIRDSIRRSKACDWLVETAVVTEVDEYAKADAE